MLLANKLCTCCTFDSLCSSGVSASQNLEVFRDRFGKRGGGGGGGEE